MDNKIIGLIIVIFCFTGSIAYALFVEGSAGGFDSFLSLPVFGFIVGVGGGFVYMKKPKWKKKKLGKVIKKDFILAGWLGFIISLVLMFEGYGFNEGENMGGGLHTGLISLLYGYTFGNIIEFFLSE